MAEAVVGFLMSPLVKMAKDKLGSAIAEQTNLLWNFGDDLNDMKSNLEDIDAALKAAERQSVKDETFLLWQKRLKDAAMDMIDMLEDYEDTTHQATSKMLGVFSCLPIAYKNIVMVNRMKSMRENLTKINEHFERFKVETNPNINPFVEHHGKDETTSDFLPEEFIVGRDAIKQEIFNKLSASTNNDETVIVPIYGLGGIGKSTLAKLVYEDTKFKTYDYRVWVYVKQDFNLLEIGNSIIAQLEVLSHVKLEQGKNDRNTLELIRLCLADLLTGKKILMVLDDIWEENNEELKKLRHMLHVKGNMIHAIVTTRNKHIAFQLCARNTHMLQPLGDGICWEIIKRFSKFECKSNQERLEQIGLDIAKKCGGVPLAAQALGEILESIDHLSEWEKIRNSDFWNGSSDDTVLPSLKLTYERMPPQLRICFSYCAMFPKGHNIVEDDLIHQWIALGFIKPSEGKECVKQLLKLSFLQVSKLRSDSKEHVVRYTMHDLVHELARLTMSDDLIIFDGAPDRNTCSKKYRYSLLEKYDGATKLANILSSKIRALHFSDIGKMNIHRSAFSFANYLRTLDFSECPGILLPASVGHLKQMRYLVAPRMQNENLPKFITKLSKLQHLNIDGSSKISSLPKSIGNLGCLKYLSLLGCSGISKLPESFGKLKCMVHLGMSGCSRITELPDSLGNLTNLEHLELSGCFSLREIPESLCGLTQLKYLNLSSCTCVSQLPEAIGSLVNLEYLNISSCDQIGELPEALVKLEKLSYLDLSGCTSMQEESPLGGVRHIVDKELHVLGDLTNLKYLRLSLCVMPGVGFIRTLTNLEHLDLSWNLGLARLPESIGNLKRLRTLDLTNCKGLRSLPESTSALGLRSLLVDGCSDELIQHARSLGRLVFNVLNDYFNGRSNLHELEGVHHVSDLKILALENTWSLKEANEVKLVQKHELSKLRLVWTTVKSGDRQLLAGFGSAVQCGNGAAARCAKLRLEDKDLLGQLVPPRDLKHLGIEGYRSTSFPAWLMDISKHLTNLASFDLSDLPTCSNLPQLGQLPYLQHIRLSRLPGIKRIDMEFCGGKGAFRGLLFFEIIEMEGLEEWNTAYFIGNGVVEFMFPVLDGLTINKCQRLRFKPCPPKFQRCKIMQSKQVIYCLDEVEMTGQHYSDPSRVIQLNLVIMEKCRWGMSMFHHFPALVVLVIYGCGLMTSLPESMRHLTSLQSLTLSYCIVSALPEWLDDLSSLNSLVIKKCDALKMWCESEENKTKLERLQIEFRD